MSEAVTRALELIAILRNDMHRIVETQCRYHGRPGAAPSLTACLIPLVACETVGALTTSQTQIELGPRATREFIEVVGHSSGDGRYSKLAGRLFGLFRHGIAHSFMPKRYILPGTTTRVRAASLWSQDPHTLISDCTDWLRSPEGAARLMMLRRERHLIVRMREGDVVICVSPQVLAIDVDVAITGIAERLRAGDGDLVRRVDANHDRWIQRVESLDERWISTAEKDYLLGICELK